MSDGPAELRGHNPRIELVNKDIFSDAQREDLGIEPDTILLRDRSVNTPHNIARVSIRPEQRLPSGRTVVNPKILVLAPIALPLPGMEPIEHRAADHLERSLRANNGERDVEALRVTFASLGEKTQAIQEACAEAVVRLSHDLSLPKDGPLLSTAVDDIVGKDSRVGTVSFICAREDESDYPTIRVIVKDDTLYVKPKYAEGRTDLPYSAQTIIDIRNPAQDILGNDCPWGVTNLELKINNTPREIGEKKIAELGARLAFQLSDMLKP